MTEFLGDLKVKLNKLTQQATSEAKKETKQRETSSQKVGRLAESKEKPPSQQSKEPKAKRNPTGMNILLLYADDWTHHTLSSFHKTQPRNTILKTPTLDALSQDGIRFTHNCVTTSVCWISRATLFTGQYMSRHNTTEPCCWSGMPKPKEKLKEAPENWKELSVYELLKKEGYHVGHAGKWGVCEYNY
jgi:arylsulfatase A-like enzyme